MCLPAFGVTSASTHPRYASKSPLARPFSLPIFPRARNDFINREFQDFPRPIHRNFVPSLIHVLNAQRSILHFSIADRRDITKENGKNFPGRFDPMNLPPNEIIRKEIQCPPKLSAE